MKTITILLALMFAVIVLSISWVFSSEEHSEDHRYYRRIDNTIMRSMYPYTYVPGNPPYIERDFEAGADFICDEILRHHKRDLCAEQPIRWRN